ncbi:MAG: Crp/Fnr family transcriptional regulator [Candidatus Bipolaricaulia bacterium]
MKIDRSQSEQWRKLKVNIALFSDLSREELVELNTTIKPIDYGRRELIFQQGAPSFGLYIILEGKVKLMRELQAEKSRILKILGPGEVLGLDILFDSATYATCAKTLEPSRLGFIERQEFLRFIVQHSCIFPRIVAQLADDLRDAWNELAEAAAYLSVREKLARVLLDLAERFGVEGRSGVVIGVRLKRIELAEMIGVAPETLVRALGQLKERGLITLEGRQIIISDRNGLAGKM